LTTLLLLRHGESEWNSKNLFTGWVDVDLTPFGEEQARRAGRMLRGAGLPPTVVHTSLLTRAVRTGNLVLEAVGRVWVPSRRHWRLNERHYGALQGREKTTIVQEYGEEQFRLWRRSYDAAPPPIGPDGEWQVTSDPRYAGLAATSCRGPNPSPTSPPACCPTGTTSSSPTCAPSGRSWSWRTATRCGHWSRTSTV
jgi:2,3-bisphosphoglycerate-dependent phosphoglycerate mutase